MYRHSQVGTVILVSVGATAVALTLGVHRGLLPTGVLALAAVFVLCLPVFGTLTVEVDGQALSLRFGFGLVTKRFALADIKGVRVVRNHWYYGWGIHRVPSGWLYNVSGLDAVEIELGDGKAHRIGTDEPEVLSRAIQSAGGLPAT